MNIDIQSQMVFGDADALRDFFFVHRLVHEAVDAVIAQAGQGSMPNAGVDSQAALDAWIGAMKKEPADGFALNDWLQLHVALHQAEYQALQLGYAPDLSSIDFSQELQFYDWMFAHTDVHDTIGNATGVF